MNRKTSKREPVILDEIPSKATWLRDALHDLRELALQSDWTASEDALRVAIIRVCTELEIPTNLPVTELVPGVDVRVKQNIDQR